MESDGDITPVLPPGLLEPTSLEVRGAWDGVPGHPAKIKISIEVQCLPNAKLQILDARSPSVRVHKILKSPLIDVHGEDNLPGDPDSPLFAFLNLASDVSVEGEGPSPPSAEVVESQSESGIFATSDERHLRLLESNSAASSLGSAEPLIQSIPAADPPSMPCVDVDPEPRSLSKRNARTACLTDSEDEKETSDRSRLGVRDEPTVHSRTRRTAASVSPKKSMKYASPLKSQHTRCASVSGISDLEERLTSSFKSIIPDVCGESVDSLFGAASRGIKGQSASEVEESGNMQRQSTKNSFIPVLKRLNTDVVRQTVEPPAPSVAEDSTDSDHMEGILHQDGPQLLRSHGPASLSTILVAEPIVKDTEGLLYLECPGNVHQAAYKIVILANILMIDENQRSLRPLHPPGWHSLIVPGLPKLKDDQNGYFLFLISPGQVIEFSTVSLNRYNMVENCFFAEFANPESFEVAMCVHDQELYGPLKDVTVDQDIRATLLPTRSHDAPLSHLRVRYHAVCSLRFGNIYVAAERCCFFLKVEGGPESFSQCTLEAMDESLQVIQLSAEISRTTESVSRIQIICSSREFDEFCLTWEVALPKEQQTYWLPSIYPDLSSVCLDRSKLRHAFTRLGPDLIEEPYPAEQNEADGEDPSETSEAYNECSSERPASADERSSETFIEVMRMMQDWELDETERPPLRVDQVIFLFILGFSLTLSSLFSPVVMTGPGVRLDDMGLGNYTGEGLVTHGHESGSNWSVMLSPACVCPQFSGPSMLLEKLVPQNDADWETQDSMDDEAWPMMDGPDKGTKEEDTAGGDMQATSLSLRDRIDYFLGWKGPVVRPNE